jgi:hypothetical protein
MAAQGRRYLTHGAAAEGEVQAKRQSPGVAARRQPGMVFGSPVYTTHSHSWSFTGLARSTSKAANTSSTQTRVGTCLKP